MEWLLGLLGLLGLVPVAVLAWLVWAPLRLRGAGVASTETRSAGRLVVRWWPLQVTLDGDAERAVVTMHLFGARVWRGRPEESASAPGARHTGRWLSGWNRRTATADGSELIRFARAQLRHVHLERLRGALRFGLEDPDATGLFDGLLWAIRASHPAATGGFEHDPVWTPGLHLDARGEVRLRAYVGRVLLAALALSVRLRGRSGGMPPSRPAALPGDR